MALTLLLDTYVFNSRSQDANNPAVVNELYDHTSYSYDDTVRAVYVMGPAAYTYANYGGAPPMPANFALDPSVVVAVYVVPPAGAGSDATATGKQRTVYHNGAGGLTYVDVPVPLVVKYLRPYAPVPPATTGTVTAIASGGTGPWSGAVDGGAATTPVPTGVIQISGLTVGAHTLIVSDAVGHTLTISFTIDPAPVIGCMLPRALNYNPLATTDASPSTCVFAAPAAPLPALVAAHLPVPVTVQASPTVGGLPALVLVVLETATSPAGPWAEFARLRKSCDATATASFNLSEHAKALLRVSTPVESGLDAGLSALLRVSYSVLDPVTAVVVLSAVLGVCRVLNAVVAPTENAPLATPAPYATLPPGAALWTTSATLAGGVVAVPLPLTAGTCYARQFVWLNAAGAWDSGFFFGRHQHGTDQAEAITYREATGTDRYARRGVVRDTLQVYSDKLDFATYQALRGIRSSLQVYERQGPGVYAPVLVAVDSYAEYQEQTDKTFTVNFTVSYPPQLIQTQ